MSAPQLTNADQSKFQFPLNQDSTAQAHHWSKNSAALLAYTYRQDQRNCSFSAQARAVLRPRCRIPSNLRRCADDRFGLLNSGRVKFGGELHGVEVPPAALRGMVGQPAVASALRAMDDGADVRQSDFDASQFELEVNGRITGDAELPEADGTRAQRLTASAEGSHFTTISERQCRHVLNA
jgi:hypothetical protein